MAAYPDGAPCWVDLVVPDLEAGKSFYGELFGWEFRGGEAQYGYYTQAFSHGRNVAAIAPLPSGDVPPCLTLYLASSDARATAAKIRENGGTVLHEPIPIGEFGTMLTARDPAGVIFGVWQAGSHTGFEEKGQPGSFCWAEVCVRETEAVDAFYPAVFPITARPMEAGPDADFKVWEVGGETVMGRFKLGPDIPANVPPHVLVYFAVDNCDDAVATVGKLGGEVRSAAKDSPYGRFAVVADQQGITFAVIDLSTTVGEPA